MRIPADAYNFWTNLKRNTEQLGSLFDLQPFTELGNITCVNDPDYSLYRVYQFHNPAGQNEFLFPKMNLVNWSYQPYYGGLFT